MDPNKPKGRARGRARGTVPADPQQPIRTPGPVPSQSGGGSGMARGRARGSVPPTASGEMSRPGGLTERQLVRGAAAAFGAMKIEDPNGSNGNGNGAPVGRGVTRGKKEPFSSTILTTRPTTCSTKSGKTGTGITLLTNYFRLDKRKDWLLCLYHVDFSPDEDRTGSRKKMLRPHAKFIGEEFIFDGMQLYTSKQLDRDKNKIVKLTSKHPDTEEIFTIKLTFIKELAPLDNQFMQILNIILRRCQDHLGLQLLGRNYYSSKEEFTQIVQQETLRVWPGYTTSIRQHETQILLNVDVTHKFLREETALSEIRKCQNNFEGFVGSIVMTNYNEKTYRVDDVNLKVGPRSTFDYRDRKISYVDYYKQKYNVIIREMNQPLIVSRPKQRDIRRGMTEDIYLVPELCIMTGLSDGIRSNRSAMRELASFMKMNPDNRVKTLQKFNKSMFDTKPVIEELKKWGLNLDKNLVEVNGRILVEEKISQGRKLFGYNRAQSDWSREIRSLPLNIAVELRNWVFMFPARLESEAKGLLSALQRVALPMGMRISQPTPIALARDAVADYNRELRQCAGKQMVMCLLSGTSADKYGSIKKIATCDLAIPSQCVLVRTARAKSLLSVASKLAIQMNCKLGGEVWNLEIPMKKSMVIGYDAYHDSINKGASYGAIVASLNDSFTKYHGQVAKHTSREELSNNFRVGTKTALQAYHKVNGAYPTKMIVFRDGVGDGQIAYVKDQEVDGILQCLQDLNAPTKLGFVIVSKRINTRIMMKKDGRTNNPPPGTVVDSVVTLPERYDFFIVSQSVNEGTVSPTSYNIIHDATGLAPDHYQRLAYKLTHLYYNWQGTVRVPAPCLYAHKLAFITGTAIHQQPSNVLCDKLWFL